MGPVGVKVRGDVSGAGVGVTVAVAVGLAVRVEGRLSAGEVFVGLGRGGVLVGARAIGVFGASTGAIQVAVGDAENERMFGPASQTRETAWHASMKTNNGITSKCFLLLITVCTGWIT